MIFVSYSANDQALVEPLVVDLGVLGHNVYFEDKSRSGSSTWDEAFRGIEQADAFVYTITETTHASYSRLLEYEHALMSGVPIIPVRLQANDAWALPPMPAIIDYVPRDPAARAELARRLNSLPSVSAEPAFISRPEPRYALAQLRRRIDTIGKDPDEAALILMNLEEFLERSETRDAAELLLSEFRGRSGHTISSGSVMGVMPARLRYRNAEPPYPLRRAFEGLLALAGTAALIWIFRSVDLPKVLGNPINPTTYSTASPTSVTATQMTPSRTPEALANRLWLTDTLAMTETALFFQPRKSTATLLVPTGIPPTVTLLPPTNPPPSAPPIPPTPPPTAQQPPDAPPAIQNPVIVPAGHQPPAPPPGNGGRGNNDRGDRGNHNDGGNGRGGGRGNGEEHGNGRGNGRGNENDNGRGNDRGSGRGRGGGRHGGG